MTIQLQLTLEEINIIWNILSQAPYNVVNNIINKIQSQVIENQKTESVDKV